MFVSVIPPIDFINIGLAPDDSAPKNAYNLGVFPPVPVTVNTSPSAQSITTQAYVALVTRLLTSAVSPLVAIYLPLVNLTIALPVMSPKSILILSKSLESEVIIL